MHPAVKTLLTTKQDVDILIFFEIKVTRGESDVYYRHVIDNYLAVTDDGTVMWTPWVINTQEFIYRLKDDIQPTEITLYDPEDASLPGLFKTLLQYEKILNRSTFSLWVAFKDVWSGLTQTTSGTFGGTVFSFASPHGLWVYDKFEALDDSGVWREFEVDTCTDTEITFLNPAGFDFFAETTIRKPMYKDKSTWIQKISGKLRGHSYTEGVTVFKIGQESDILQAEIPNVLYSYSCPYKPGDQNCMFSSTTHAISAVYNIDSVSGRTVVISGSAVGKPLSSVPYVTSLPSPFATDTSYWTLGSFVVLTGPLQGIVRSVRASVYDADTGKFTLTLDQAIPGTYTSGSTVELHFNCNRAYEDCAGRFCNSANFGGLESIVRVLGGINAPRQITTK